MMERTNLWLKERLAYLWERHFPDVPARNPITIAFGRPAATRLGSIRQQNPRDPKSATLIRINGLFSDPAVPEYVLDEVLAHELTHYAHGFHGAGPKLHPHPHKGGVVTKELIDRGLHNVIQSTKDWLKHTWPKIVADAYRMGIVSSPKRRIRWLRRSIGRVYFL